MSGADDGEDLLAEAMQELYAADPDAFMATRTRLVTSAKAGDPAVAKEIGALRKPTLAAWALNTAVRADHGLAERLVQVGQQLRAAQSALDMARMQVLRPDRDALIKDVVGACVAAAGDRTLSPAVRETLSATVVAALASQEATTAVVSGALTRALSYSGFGEVDLDEAVVRTSSGAILTVLPGAGLGAADADDDEADDHEDDGGEDDAFTRAEADLDRAEAELEEAKAAVADARDRSSALRSEIEEAEQALKDLRARDEEVLEELAEAVAARKAAEAARTGAARAMARARRV